MNILAFDSSLNALSVAVARRRQEAWLVSQAWEARTGHAERLMPMIGEVMAEAGMAFSAIDRIGVTVGPGSFTGVRVGVAAARGLALALKRPAIGFTNLAVMAHDAVRLLRGAHAGRLLAVVIDARDGGSDGVSARTDEHDGASTDDGRRGVGGEQQRRGSLVLAFEQLEVMPAVAGVDDDRQRSAGVCPQQPSRLVRHDRKVGNADRRPP